MSNLHVTNAFGLQPVGNIEAAVKTYSKMTAINDGRHYYSISEAIPDEKLPLDYTHEINISMTNTNVDVTQIHDSFITTVISARINFSHDLVTRDNVISQAGKKLLESQFMFIGLRSGSNIISDYCVVHGEDKIIDSTRQPNATIESFIYNTIKPKTEKDNRKHIHSLYDNVHKYDNSACGVYVPITLIKAGSYLDIDIPISIPLDDNLLFSGFIDYPNRLFGNLKLKYTIKPEALVHCRVSPKMSMIKTVGKRRNNFKSSQGQNYYSIMKMILTTPDSCFEYAKKFTQINCPSRQFVFNDDLTAEGTVDRFNYETIIFEFTPTVTFCQTKDCKISIAGYSVSSQCLTNLVEYFSSHPFVVPSQSIETKRLGSAPSPSGFQQCHDNLYFNHVMSTVTLI